MRVSWWDVVGSTIDADEAQTDCDDTEDWGALADIYLGSMSGPGYMIPTQDK